MAAAEALDADLVRRWVERAASELHRQRDFLTQLDAAIGDADHGVNMDRGFSAARDAIRPDDAGPGRLLDEVGSTLILRVGGAAGPLYGVAFRRAAASLGDASSAGAEETLVALRAGLAGIQKLGAAVGGDKTIVDAFAPALGAFERALRAGGDLEAAAAQAAQAADAGAKATIPLQARKGRASYLGPRSVGHQDPGATSTALLFEALARAVSA
jgi:dihydroxyacetone kinase-like protein